MPTRAVQVSLGYNIQYAEPDGVPGLLLLETGELSGRASLECHLLLLYRSGLESFLPVEGLLPEGRDRVWHFHLRLPEGRWFRGMGLCGCEG